MGDNALSRAWKRLTSSQVEVESEHLREAARKAGAVSVGSCRDREVVRLRGTLASVTLAPKRGSSWLEAVLDDGSGLVNLIWMGRRAIPGIVAGAEIIVEGRLLSVDGNCRIFNPRYELIASGGV